MKRLGILLIFVLANIYIYKVYPQTSDASKIARTAFQHGDYSESVKWYKSAITLTDNPDEKAALNKSLSQAQSCAANLSQADTFFSRGNYTAAQELYQKLLAVNPSDSYAKQRIAKCGIKIRDAANRQKRDEAYRTAMLNGDDESIRAFLRAYPDDEMKGLLTLILYNDKETEEYIGKQVNARHSGSLSGKEYATEFEKLLSQHYISVGEVFAKAGNKEKALRYYEMATVYGDADALYRRAMCYEDLLEPIPLNLLAIAAAGNCDMARDKLTNLMNDHPSLRYDKDVATRLFDNLQRRSVASAMYIYTNADLYGITKESAMRLFPKTDEKFIESMKNVPDGDQILCQYGKILIEANRDPKKVMYASAECGNLEALEWIAQNTDDEEYKICYSHSRRPNEYYKAYIKYLRGEKLTAGGANSDWFNLYLFVKYDLEIDRHLELLSLVKADPFMDKHFYERLNELLAKDEFWDKGVISDLLAFDYKIDPNRIAKVKKMLSKVRTANGLYKNKKEEAPEYRLANLGIYDNFHQYIPQIKAETLWKRTPPASRLTASTATSSSATTATAKSSASATSNSGTSSSSGRATTSSATPKYELGQDVGDGYVFFLDSSGQHGWIVSKTIYSISPQTSYKFHPDAGWRFAKSSDLVHIYKLGRFPTGNYFGKNGPNITDYVVIVFNKNNVYKSQIRWDATYSLLLVKPF